MLRRSLQQGSVLGPQLFAREFVAIEGVLTKSYSQLLRILNCHVQPSRPMDTESMIRARRFYGTQREAVDCVEKHFF